jgi:hypothetical protein
MKILFLVCFSFFSVSRVACHGQSKDNQYTPAYPIILSDDLQTLDSISYEFKKTSSLVNGTYRVYLVVELPHVRDPGNDTPLRPPVRITDMYSKGTFTKGRKTGLWTYYNGKKKLKEETYQNGRRVSVRKCPCK